MLDRKPQRASIPLWGVAVVASQSLMTAAGADPTPAFPAAENDCNDRTLDWEFDSDWPSQQQTWAEEGLQYIDNAATWTLPPWLRSTQTPKQ